MYSFTYNHESATQIIRNVVDIIGRNKVVDVNPISHECEEMIPCSGHQGAKITISNGTTHHFNCGSPEIAALEIFFFPERYNTSYTGDRHFIEYINNKAAVELSELKSNIYETN